MGEVVVFTNLHGERETFPVKVKGCVVSDIWVKPKMLIFSESERKVQVHLGSAAGRDFQLSGPPQIVGDVDLNDFA